MENAPKRHHILTNIMSFRVVDSEVLPMPDTLEVITNTLDLPELGTILLQKMP